MKLKKHLKKTLIFTMVLSIVIATPLNTSAYQYSEDIIKNGPEELINNDIRPTNKGESKSVKDNDAQTPQSTPKINDWLKYKTSRLGETQIHYIDGLSFENHDKIFETIGSETKQIGTGLTDVSIIEYAWEYNSPSISLDKIVIPYMDIEQDDSYSNKAADGYQITLECRYQEGVGATRMSYNISKKDALNKPTITISKQEIVDKISSENQDTFYQPFDYSISIHPIDSNGERIDQTNLGGYIGINKLTQTAPVEFQYTVKDEPLYGSAGDTWNYGYYKATCDYFGDTGNVAVDNKTMFPYFETSDVKITSDKTDNLKPGDVVNLNIEITNPTKFLVNEYLKAGFDVVSSDGKTLVSSEYDVVNEDWIEGENEDGKYILDPGKTVDIPVEYKIPADYKGTTLELNPYLYGAYGETGKFVYVSEEKEYNEGIVLNIIKSGSGGGSGGGSIDPNPPTTPKTVILASGEKYTDVLTATVLGNEKDAPILLTQKDSIDDKTISEIKRLGVEDIIISGGVNSVSEKVVEQLKGYNITRIAGEDRYETAELIGNEVRKTGNKQGAMLVDGTNYPDVITISTLASEKRLPILLTDPNNYTDTTKDAIDAWGINDITIGGGYNSVSKDIESNINLGTVKRLGGSDRYETAEIIATELRKSTGNNTDMILVDGTNFPDGLTVNSLSAKFKSPIMLTEPETLNTITKNKIDEWSIKNILIAGGYNSVSKKIEDNLTSINKERISGEDRYETAVKISQRLESNLNIGSK